MYAKSTTDESMGESSTMPTKKPREERESLRLDWSRIHDLIGSLDNTEFVRRITAKFDASQLTSWEKLRSTPCANNVLPLCLVCDVSLPWLFGAGEAEVRRNLVGMVAKYVDTQAATQLLNYIMQKALPVNSPTFNGEWSSATNPSFYALRELARLREEEAKRKNATDELAASEEPVNSPLPAPTPTETFRSSMMLRPLPAGPPHEGRNRKKRKPK